MGLFSDTKHTHPGIFILESPPRASETETLVVKTTESIIIKSQITPPWMKSRFMVFVFSRAGRPRPRASAWEMNKELIPAAGARLRAGLLGLYVI